MTADDKMNYPQARPLILSAWPVVVAALVLYGLTLNHWVSLRSLPLMAQVTGWDWQPYPLEWRTETMAPLFLVLTAPVRFLPAAWQPVVLNAFTAVCAALTLGLLARSVRLLPHDRTRDQRLRALGPQASLCFRAAFLPTLFAVLLLGTQLTFWQNAVVATGEMLNVLVFACVIDCLLEYRVSRNAKWLLGSAFVYGLGTSNNWALLGFFPLYLIALLCFKGFAGFFNRRFLPRMFGCGLAGLSLYLLIPFLGSAGGDHENFFSLLHLELGAQTYGLRSVPRWVGLLAAVPTVLPMIFASVKWPSFDAEISAAGGILTRFMLGVLHVAFLAMALVTFFDVKFSPSARMHEQPVSFLTFYYMGALSVGYFSGYMLLVFGKARLQPWERRHPLHQIFYHLLYGLTWAVALAAPVLLAWQSFPHIRAGNTNALQQFADQTLDCLPQKKAIVLSDDVARLYLLQADYDRRGLRNEHFLIETESFPHREYIKYLVSHYPELKSVMTTNPDVLPSVLSSRNMAQFMYLVTRNYPVYYLHPSFGYYFEALYLKPSGLVYELKPYVTNMTQPPLVTDAEIKTNQAFWARLENGPLKKLPALAKLNAEAQAVSIDYSVGLDFWGTELQKANHLLEAHGQFAEAIQLDTNNFIASINQQYNEHLQKGDHRPIRDSAETLNKAMYYYGSGLVLRRNGPADEPGLDLQLGMDMAMGRNLRQASILFQRRLQLLPGDPEAELALAKTDVDRGQPAKALELLGQLADSATISAWEVVRCKALAYMAETNYALAEKVLHDAIQQDPKDENRVATLAEYYRVRGVEFLAQNKEAEAARAFANALTNIALQLKLVESSSHDTAPTFDVPEVLLKKAELEMRLRSYPAAVATFGQVLQQQPKNYNALLNRAESEIQLKQFQAARDDFKDLGRLLFRQPYVAEFGLAELAAAQTNKAEEMDHLKRGLKSAPKESSDYRQATKRLDALEHGK
jgi:thioredoxin-like negative regulator of GroEL